MTKRWEFKDTVYFLGATIVLIFLVGVAYAYVERKYVVWVWIGAMGAIAIDSQLLVKVSEAYGTVC